MLQEIDATQIINRYARALVGDDCNARPELLGGIAYWSAGLEEIKFALRPLSRRI
jgi:hypothetical protein